MKPSIFNGAFVGLDQAEGKDESALMENPRPIDEAADVIEILRKAW